jgi:GxxExxY protein
MIKILLNHRGHRVEINKLTEKIIGCAIEVHKELGPGLLESTYEQCLARELTLNKINFEI